MFQQRIVTKLAPGTWAGTLAVLCATTSASFALADDCDPGSKLSTCINADSFWPHAGASRLQFVGGTETTAPSDFSMGIVTTYAGRPIVLRPVSQEDSDEVLAVERMLTAHFLWGLGITKRLELSVAMPITLYQTGLGTSPFTSTTSSDIPSTATRDFRFGLAYAVLPRDRVFPGNPVAVTARFETSAPMGDEHAFGGEHGAVLSPSISADIRSDRFFAGLELGARIRRPATLAGTVVGSQAVIALGAGFDLVPRERLSLAIETYALPSLVSQKDLTRDSDTQVFVSSPSDDHFLPAEWLATFRALPSDDGDLSLSLSGGSALPLAANSATAASYRLVAGVRFAPLARDTDGDGILDRLDQCPSRAEDRDGFQDEDGCPELDNDGDTIPDELDRCRDTAEDADGIDDQDGCPELDDDKDGIEDVNDLCRDKPEDNDGFQDADGCPDLDNDKDGIEDTKDRCPNGAEDIDGIKDDDGCPDSDDDLDLIEDSKDLCPTEREDKDGFEDSDGCPEVDNDADGVLDVQDRCPMEAETINGVDDSDGCPEPGAKDLTLIQGSTISIQAPLRFAKGSATVSAPMRKQLRMMGQRALGQQPLQAIVVQTFADTPVANGANEELAANRADAIRTVLLELGLPPTMVIAAVGELTAARPPTAPQFEMQAQKASRK